MIVFKSIEPDLIFKAKLLLFGLIGWCGLEFIEHLDRLDRLVEIGMKCLIGVATAYSIIKKVKDK